MSEPDPGGPPSTIVVSPSAQPPVPERPKESEDVASHSDDGGSGDESLGSFDDDDSAEGDFVTQHCLENGRGYANESYCFPNDEAEETRLAIVHQVHLLLLKGELTLTRIPRGVKRILDVGTGPGDWAIAMGELYPRAEIIGTDITTYRPINVPSNVTFQIEDGSQEWTWDEPFDFIHMRDMHGAFRDFGQAYRQAARYLKPSASLEIANGGPFRVKHNYETSYSKAWIDACRVAMEESGFAWWNSYADKELVERSGLRVIKHQHMEIRLGDWTDNPHLRRLGRMALVACCESLEACSLRILTRYLGWSVDQIAELNENVKAELTDLSREPYLELEFIVAMRLPGLDI